MIGVAASMPPVFTRIASWAVALVSVLVLTRGICSVSLDAISALPLAAIRCGVAPLVGSAHCGVLQTRAVDAAHRLVTWGTPDVHRDQRAAAAALLELDVIVAWHNLAQPEQGGRVEADAVHTATLGCISTVTLLGSPPSEKPRLSDALSVSCVAFGQKVADTRMRTFTVAF